MPRKVTLEHLHGTPAGAASAPSGAVTDDSLIATAIEVIGTEARALESLCARVGRSFVDAVRLILACEGRVVVTGMGKSGHIGNKIAATLASAGTPSFFVHPAEASHGDLGMITRQDVVLALSNSGETDELLLILPRIKRIGAGLVTLTGNESSRLAREADVNIDVSVEKEACPLGLAPTASTTAALAMGDALALALLEARGFSAEDFAHSHPAGRLGRRLLLHLRDVMHTGDGVPRVNPDTPLGEALMEMTRKGLGMTAVTDERGALVGVFTDGDLRRMLDNRMDVHAVAIGEVMTRSCVTAAPEMLAAEALNIMQTRKINALLVLDADRRLVGALNMHDLLRAGVL